MTAKTIDRQILTLRLSQTMASRIWNTQSGGMWYPCPMFPESFDLHRSQRVTLEWRWWRSMPSKQGRIREWRKTRTECVNVSPASLCILTESFCWTYIMGEWWAVSCEYQLINRYITGCKKHLRRYIEFLSYENERCKNVTTLGFATCPSLNWSEKLTICSNHEENNYQW